MTVDLTFMYRYKEDFLLPFTQEQFADLIKDSWTEMVKNTLTLKPKDKLIIHVTITDEPLRPFSEDQL